MICEIIMFVYMPHEHANFAIDISNNPILTFLEAFSIALHLADSYFVSYSLAPPRIERMNDDDDGMLLLMTPLTLLIPPPRRLVHAEALPLRVDIVAREKMQFLMVIYIEMILLLLFAAVIYCEWTVEGTKMTGRVASCSPRKMACFFES